MKVAVTSTDNQLESVIDPRFGRCAYFTIYDTVSHAVDFFYNQPNEPHLIEEGGFSG
ncbi:MAG: NifB/NifX family molybdenum-iron cluster-binding protein [Paludibacter sp.]|nr:NifB/NifX family molybdenum-iron cluster-binding protein [Paludibacter sp.]